MNVLNSQDEQSFLEATRARLLGLGFEKLKTFSDAVADLSSSLEALKSIGDDNTRRRVDRLTRQIENFEPSVTMIGQIKSGKTSLVNGMIGIPDLLPADVNPWTSVVTSLHLYPEASGVHESASFQFFDMHEWDRLVSGGGRIGELASRTGADAELEIIKEQISKMREKSRERLGRKFELLLGQKREYGYFDKQLIESYVCLGEDFGHTAEAEETETHGRFADVTKSADLTLQRAGLPMRMCLRDTPGVNDTFMMREQVTIRAIRDSKICVVVLSAHQALSSTDMAIIRLISQVKSRDVIIFVNRIDELSDPGSQVPQIRQSIQETLTRHKGPEDAAILFGCALWANCALLGTVGKLPAPSVRALSNWAHSFSPDGRTSFDNEADNTELAWQLSGLSELHAVISDRIVAGAGEALLQRVGASGHNLASGVAAALRLKQKGSAHSTDVSLSPANAKAEMARISSDGVAELERQMNDVISVSHDRMVRAQESFLDRATAALIRHLESYGEHSPWTYDPTGLRLLLNTSHKVFAKKAGNAFEAVARDATARVTQLYEAAFGVDGQHMQVIAPRAPLVPPPVSLGRTIALDLSASWWKRWWLQRRGYSAYAESFRELIKSETDPVISELTVDLATEVKQGAISVLEAFFDEQLAMFETLERMQSSGADDVSELLERHRARPEKVQIEDILVTLNGYAAS